MDEITRRYDRLSARFATRVAAVPADRWDAPTPCEDWTVTDLVAHVVDAHRMFLGLIDRAPSAAPAVTDDPTAAVDAARRDVLAALQDPATATTTYEGAFGVRTFAWGVDSFLSFDLAVHGWDLARATDQDEAIDPAEVERLRRDAEGWGEMARGPTVFGPPVDVPDDADAQARLLAFLGRRP